MSSTTTTLERAHEMFAALITGEQYNDYKIRPLVDPTNPGLVHAWRVTRLGRFVAVHHTRHGAIDLAIQTRWPEANLRLHTDYYRQRYDHDLDADGGRVCTDPRMTVMCEFCGDVTTDPDCEHVVYEDDNVVYYLGVQE